MEFDKKILLIEFCNYEDYPIGGLLSFAKNLMSSFGNQLYLVGISTEKNDPIGKWCTKTINGTPFHFFALARYDRSETKHLIPDRLASYLLLKRYRSRITKFEFANVFIQRPDILIAVRNFKFKNICYRFGGLENPLSFSKYWYAEYAAKYFDKLFFSSVKHVKTILVSGDDEAIKQMLVRSENLLSYDKVRKFPTRINTQIFKPVDRSKARDILGLAAASIIISTTGRLSSIKGWKLMIDSFKLFHNTYPDSFFYFIGEGEDCDLIKQYINKNNLNDHIILIGKREQSELSLFLNASDLFIMGSKKEGWCTTLVEAMACGIPICTTNFSSAREIVLEGVNGFVVDCQLEEVFFEKMKASLQLDRKTLPISNEIKKYAVSELRSDLLKAWSLS